MLDYAVEAAEYDATRGGLPRAVAAAEAVLRLRPVLGVTLDVGGGTGIVSHQVATLGGAARVAVLDRQPEMLRYGVPRLPGAVVAADAARLPVADESVDTVCFVWLLHLLPDAEPALREAARVLRPGGVLVTTVDKAASNGRHRPEASDEHGQVVAVCARLGLTLDGETTFVGVGQEGDPVYRLVALRRQARR